MEEQKDLLVKWVGDLEVKATSDVFDGEILDTKIEIQGGTLCWVSGSVREEFLKKLNELIAEYRI